MEHSFIDKYSALDSFIHKIDPRIKIIVFFGFILFVVFTPPVAYPVFGLYLLLCLALAVLSKVPLSFVLKRCLEIIPFVVVIAAFLPFMKDGGLLIFWNVLVKSVLSCCILVILSSTTKYSDLLKAFGALGAPKIFIMILSFMYRYIFVLTDELMRMRRAKESRTVGGGRFFHIKVLSNMVGVLFLRAYSRAERVYIAMCSRGYKGEMHTLSTFKARPADYCFAAVVFVLLFGARSMAG